MSSDGWGGLLQIVGILFGGWEYLRNRRQFDESVFRSFRQFVTRLRDRILRRTHPVGKSVSLKWDVEAHETLEEKVGRLEKLLRSFREQVERDQHDQVERLDDMEKRLHAVTPGIGWRSWAAVVSLIAGVALSAWG